MESDDADKFQCKKCKKCKRCKKCKKCQRCKKCKKCKRCKKCLFFFHTGCDACADSVLCAV